MEFVSGAYRVDELIYEFKTGRKSLENLIAYKLLLALASGVILDI
jgi:hypothetical protein